MASRFAPNRPLVDTVRKAVYIGEGVAQSILKGGRASDLSMKHKGKA